MTSFGVSQFISYIANKKFRNSMLIDEIGLMHLPLFGSFCFWPNRLYRSHLNRFWCPQIVEYQNRVQRITLRKKLIGTFPLHKMANANEGVILFY